MPKGVRITVDTRTVGEVGEMGELRIPELGADVPSSTIPSSGGRFRPFAMSSADKEVPAATVVPIGAVDCVCVAAFLPILSLFASLVVAVIGAIFVPASGEEGGTLKSEAGCFEATEGLTQVMEVAAVGLPSPEVILLGVSKLCVRLVFKNIGS